MVGVVILLVLGVISEAHKYETTESQNVNSPEIENDMTNTAYNIDATELMFIQSVISQLEHGNLTNALERAMKEMKGSANYESDERDEVASKDANSSSASTSDEENTPVKTDETSALEKSDSEEFGRSAGKSSFDKKRKNILEYLSQMLSRHTNNDNIETNRRLDLEDNGGFSGLVDIDNPKFNDYNQDGADFRARFQNFRRFIGYGGVGKILDTKGRSGHDGSVPNSYITDRTFYRPDRMHGLFMNPGFYQTQTPFHPQNAFTKIDNRDIILPTGRWANLPLRLENEAQETIEKPVSAKASVWDTDGNAYLYEPKENNHVKQLPLSYGR